MARAVDARPLTPRNAKYDLGITPRDRILAAECSSSWADDIWHGHDRDYLGNRTGSGTRKIKCSGTSKQRCGRMVPPQDVVIIPPASRWPPSPHVQGPPPPTRYLCTDCRTIAAEPDRHDRRETIVRGVRLQRADRSCIGEYVAVPFLVAGDGSPAAAVQIEMEAVNVFINVDPLPAEDDATLAQAVAIYTATGRLADFARVSGDAALAMIQRRRYGVARRITV